MKTSISEIFSSIQGEGKYVGCRQMFIRFVGCNLSCRYCDTEHQQVPIYCDAEDGALNNPIAVEDLVAYLQPALTKIPHHSISLTGGEPLLYADFIRELIAQLPFTYFLETNGTMPEKLRKIIDKIDIISMDIKMPDSIGQDYWSEHQRFLEIAKRKDVYTKVVIAAETPLADFEKALDMVASVDKNILFVVQPMTPLGGYHAPSPEQISRWQEIALQKLCDVRVIPQTHKFIQQR